MKNLIMYFSATGNTARAMDLIAGELKAKGDEATLLAVSARTAVPPDIAAYGRIILAFPVLAFNPPAFFVKFAKSLPRAASVDRVVAQSSDNEFHCYSLTLFYKPKAS